MIKSPSITKEITFRPMRSQDIPSLVEIERSWDGSNWNQQMFERELSLPMSTCLVAETSGLVVGFGVFWTVTDTAQLLEFAVHQTYRRKGLGTELIKCLIEAARIKKCLKIELELHEDNFPAQSFYEKIDFKVVGKRRKFYARRDGRMCDAILMERTL